MSRIRVAAIVVAYEGGDALVSCVDALNRTVYRGLEVVVVDNGSRAGDLGWCSERRAQVLALPSNMGFAGGVNAGIDFHRRRFGVADVYALVNQDCLVSPGWLGPLVVALLADPQVAVAGARLYDNDGATLQHAGAVVEPNGLTRHLGRGSVDPAAHRMREDVDYVTGALCAFRASTWFRHGPFDEGYFPAYFEEVDFCHRCRKAGERILYVPESEAIHAESSVLKAGSSAYLRSYHAGRIRFAALHLLVRGHTLCTLGHEAKWLLSRRSFREVAPVVSAYWTLPVLLTRRWRGRKGVCR